MARGGGVSARDQGGGVGVWIWELVGAIELGGGLSY